jgi:hypothetical protein
METERSWWREPIGLGVLRCPLPSMQYIRTGSTYYDHRSPRHHPAQPPADWWTRRAAALRSERYSVAFVEKRRNTAAPSPGSKRI